MGNETKTQHTPGPWVADRLGNVWEGSVAPGPTPSQRRNSLRIAVVEQSADRLPEDAANARLIAAAPELLEMVAEFEVAVSMDFTPGRNERLAQIALRAGLLIRTVEGKS